MYNIVNLSLFNEVPFLKKKKLRKIKRRRKRKEKYDLLCYIFKGRGLRPGVATLLTMDLAGAEKKEEEKNTPNMFLHGNWNAKDPTKAT